MDPACFIWNRVCFQGETRMRALGLQRMVVQTDCRDRGLCSGEPPLGINDLFREPIGSLKERSWRRPLGNEGCLPAGDTPFWVVHQHISPPHLEVGCRSASEKWCTLSSQPTLGRWAEAWKLLQEAGTIWFGCLPAVWLFSHLSFNIKDDFRHPMVSKVSMWVWQIGHGTYVRPMPFWNSS